MGIRKEANILPTYPLLAESSPYQKFVGPNPIKRPPTAAEIAERRMNKLKEKLGIKVSVILIVEVGVDDGSGGNSIILVGPQ